MDHFLLTFPCWLLAMADRGARSGGKGPRNGAGPDLLLMANEAGQLAVPVFTDGHLADAFRAAPGVPDRAEPVDAAGPGELADWLGYARACGAAAVVFDPSKCHGRVRRAWGIRHVIRALRAGRHP